MKALVLVAHPDDCVIFASGYMDAHPEHEWSIVYLTCWRFHKRGREIARYWHKRGVKTKFLGFKDHGRDLGLNGLHTWPEIKALKALHKAALGYDLILTHGAKGEYGHPHHAIVHKSVKDFNVSKVYFSMDENDLMLPLNIEMAELPRHAESILIHAVAGVAYYKEYLK
jgi:LmbE family N-acetylglucosaminyl deacetylase